MPAAEETYEDLLVPANLPRPTREVRRILTHASRVFVADADVYKTKRPKDYGFFDYTTPERRRFFCEEEVRLNRRAAPDVYLGVLPVRRDAKGHSLSRPGGETVDWAVHMRRLPTEASALARLAAGTLSHDDIEAVAAAVSRFYATADSHPPRPQALRESIRENFAQTGPFVGSILDRAAFEEARDAQEAWLARHDARLQTRGARDGHGDLRLEHVYFDRGRVLVIDCIEFLDRFRIADPALDAAFLAMDLCERDRADLAERFLADFAYESDDYGFYPLADGYVSYRAWVRAKIACLLASDASADAALARERAGKARALLTLARDVLRPRGGTATLIGTAGLVGSGKSTLAWTLARSLGAPVVSADATRKHLAGLAHDAPGGADLYTPAMHVRTLDEILARAGDVLESGRTVVLDTTFSARPFRDRARALAGRHGARFLLAECRVPESVARARLRARTGGVSDAREGQYDLIASRFDPIGESPADAHIVLDATLPPDGNAARVIERLGPTPTPRPAGPTSREPGRTSGSGSGPGRG